MKTISITTSLNGKNSVVSAPDVWGLTNVELAALYDMAQMVVREQFELTRLESTAIAEVAATINKQK